VGADQVDTDGTEAAGIEAGDDLSRQRRKREARLLAQVVPDDPTLTVGDLVADVLAAVATARAEDGEPEVDVAHYLAERGHGRGTVATVLAYLERQQATLEREQATPSVPTPPARG
jgi:hypothetical protein